MTDMIYFILYTALIATSFSFVTQSMERPPDRIADRIITAVKNGDLARLQWIHRDNPTISYTHINLNGMPLIHIAATSHHVSIMDYLIKQVGLDPKTFFHGQTILHTAAQEGSVPMSRYLIENNIFDKNVTDLRNQTPLDIAKARKRFALINYLVIPPINPTVTFAQHLKKVGDKKQALSQFVTPHNHKSLCSICFEEKHFKEFSVLECEHSYCTNCITQHIAHAINNDNSEALRCPTPKCKMPLGPKDTNTLLNNNAPLKSKLSQIQFNTWLMQQKNRTACPTPDCSFIFINERTDQFTMQCPSCDATYCAQCLTQHSARITCHEVKENKKVIADKKEQEEATERWKEQNSRPCPQCKVSIEKSEGCNHMICRTCKHEFCWQCMKPYEAKGHGPFGCSLANPRPAAAGAPQMPTEELSDMNAHLFFTRDPLGFKHLLTRALTAADFFERFKRLSCEQQDEWSARVSQRIEQSFSPFINPQHFWIRELTIVERGESEPQLDSDNGNGFHPRGSFIILNGMPFPAHLALRILLALATANQNNHPGHHANDFQDDLDDLVNEEES